MKNSGYDFLSSFDSLCKIQCTVFCFSANKLCSGLVYIEHEYIFFSGMHFHGQGATRASSSLSSEFHNSSRMSHKRNQVLCGIRRNSAPHPCHQCPNCSEILPDESSLTYHISNCQRQAGTYGCFLCSKTYSTPTGLKHHMEVHEGKTFMCPICDSKFTRKGTVKTHMRAVHSSAQCVNCAAILRLGEEFNQHVIRCVK